MTNLWPKIDRSNDIITEMVFPFILQMTISYNVRSLTHDTNRICQNAIGTKRTAKLYVFTTTAETFLCFV